jgi:hypothetical protein
MSPFAIVFDQVGTFAANDEAKRQLEAHGFSVGPSQRGAPRAVMYGDYAISKWRNLNPDERRETHATLTGDGREGPLTFRLLPAATDEAVEAAERMRAAISTPPLSQEQKGEG